MLSINNNLVENNPKIKQKKAETSSFAGNYATAPIQYEQVLPNYNYVNYAIQPKIPQNYSKIGEVKTPYGESVHLYMLNNGQKIAIMPKAGTTIVKTFVNSGSMNETDKERGISHFIEHNLFNGSSKLEAGQLFREVSKMGAQTNASTNFAQTDYYISSAIMEGNDLPKTIEMQSDMILNPKFLNEMIEKEKGPVTSEISMVNDDMATIAINRVIKDLFQINSSSTNLVAGSIETVNNIKRDDVVNYWQKHYTPDNMTTVVVGDVDPNSTMELIAKNFNAPPVQNANLNRKSEKLTPTQKPTRVDFISPKDNSTVVVSAFAGPVAGDTKENLALEALSLLLVNGSNSRLGKNLEKINSYVSMDSQKIGLQSNDPTAVTVAIESPKNMEQNAIDMLYGAITDAKINPATPVEMQVIKNAMTKGLCANYENSEAICDMVGTSMLNGDLASIGHYQNIINSLTPNDIMMAANRYLDLNKVAIGVVHPSGTSQNEIINNYKSGQFSKKATQPSFTSNVAFTGKTLDTSDVAEMKLKDNSYLALNNSTSNIAYFNWKLTSYSSTPKNPATSYILTELLNNGSINRTREAYRRDAELKGIDFSFDSNGFSITANANCLANNSLDTISMMKEAVLNPRFSEREFQIAKQKVGAYCASLGKSASDSLIAKLYPEYFAESASIIEGLKNLTLDDVKNHYNHLINNASSNMVVTAPIENNPNLANAIIDKAAANVHKYKNPKTRPEEIYKPTEKTRILLNTEERNQAEIFKTYSFKMSGNIEDEIKFELLNTILGGSPASRLFQDLREKQKLAYRVSSEVQSFGDTGILTFFTLTTTDDKAQNDIKYDNLQKSLEGFRAHAQKLVDEPVSEEELENAKKALKQQIFKQMEMPASKTLLLSMNAGLPFGIKRIDEYFKAIDKMTVADIQKAAAHVFSNKPVVSILASEDTIKNQTPYLQSLGEINK